MVHGRCPSRRLRWPTPSFWDVSLTDGAHTLTARRGRLRQRRASRCRPHHTASPVMTSLPDATTKTDADGTWDSRAWHDRVADHGLPWLNDDTTNASVRFDTVTFPNEGLSPDLVASGQEGSGALQQRSASSMISCRPTLPRIHRHWRQRGKHWLGRPPGGGSATYRLYRSTLETCWRTFA